MSERVTILFLGANPSNETRLALGQEHREIAARIRSGRYRDALRLESQWAVRPDDLQEILLEHQPHIVHFSGHGSSANELILEDDAGRARGRRLGKTMERKSIQRSTCVSELTDRLGCCTQGGVCEISFDGGSYSK
jgi:hypothetical protein